MGHNLQDHIGLGGFTFMINKEVSMVQNRIENVPAVLRYAMFGDGPLTVLGGEYVCVTCTPRSAPRMPLRPMVSPCTGGISIARWMHTRYMATPPDLAALTALTALLAGVEGLAFVNTKYANASDDWPDIEFHFVSGSTNSDGGRQLRKAHGLTDAFYNTVFDPIANKDVWSVIPVLLRPRSKGVIQLRSGNPLDYPLIYPNYFFDPQDMKVLIEGVKIGVAISRTKSFQR